jgi:hypothetical protein
MNATRPMFYPLPLIGWREDVVLTEFGDGVIIAKVDTGARNAALHAEDISLKGKRVNFVLELNGMRQRHERSVIGTKRVKSSNGFSELRPIVEIMIQVGIHKFPVETTLTNRTDMGVPMLLGRNSIKGRFIVNPARSFIISRLKKKRT